MAKRKTKTRNAKTKAGKLVHDLGEWRWVLAMLIVLTLVILIWGKRIP